MYSLLIGAGDRNRTYNLLITSQLLYRWATLAYGGNSRTRTCDPMINSHLLYQLSHIPICIGGDTQIRTGDQGVAVHCLTTWLCRLISYIIYYITLLIFCEYFFIFFVKFLSIFFDFFHKLEVTLRFELRIKEF